MARTTRTVTDVTDDLTGANVAETEATDYLLAIGDVSGMVTLTADSFAKLIAIPEIAKLIKAAGDYVSAEPAEKRSREAKSYAGGAGSWEVRAFGVATGSAKKTGGALGTDVATAFASAVEAGTWKVIGSAKRPADDTAEAGTLAANVTAVSKAAKPTAKK